MFDRLWGSPGRLLGVICAPVGALVVICGPLDRLLKGLGPTFESNIVEKSVFVILVPRLGETTTFEGPATQVGVTWSCKSRQGNPRGDPSEGRDGKKGAKRQVSQVDVSAGPPHLTALQAKHGQGQRSKLSNRQVI